jgi:hypothetical protein
MSSVTPSLTVSTAPVRHLSPPCPKTTVRPDSNGWVPPGTCGYISRPYYPSFTAALVFSAAAAAVLAVYVFTIGRIIRLRRRQPDPSWKNCFVLPGFAVFISTCLLVAYVLRAWGTRYMQVPEFVAFSDTLVLVCPICQSFYSYLYFSGAFASLKLLLFRLYRCSDIISGYSDLCFRLHCVRADDNLFLSQRESHWSHTPGPLMGPHCGPSTSDT